MLKIMDDPLQYFYYYSLSNIASGMGSGQQAPGQQAPGQQAPGTDGGAGGMGGGGSGDMFANLL